MPRYKIQQKITTIVSNAVMKGPRETGFSCEGIDFRHGDFNIHDGWVSEYWYAEMEIEASTRSDMTANFSEKLRRIIPRIALIGQCYISYIHEPWVITRLDKHQEYGLFRFVRDSGYVGLMFMEENKKALDILIDDLEIPDEFYLYWNDAVNTTGYSPKLLLMFSAIEAVARKRNKSIYKAKSDVFNKILGEALAKEIFDDGTGLRNRLVHGEYFNEGDNTKDYLDIIHKAVISYFNQSIFKEDLIEVDVVHPQRNPFENKEAGGPWFIKKQKPEIDFTLDNIIKKGPPVELNEDDFTVIGGAESEELNKSF